MHHDHLALAASLPDVPHWVETRGLLLSGRAGIIGMASPDAFVVRVVHGALSAVSVVGLPDAAAIRQAVSGCTELTPVIAQKENASHVADALPEWTGERAVIHTLPPDPVVPEGPALSAVRLLAPEDTGRFARIPASLRHELTHALDLAPLAAVVLDGEPVSFCYPCWRTETLWDVSVDTLEQHRGRGLALSAFRFMYDLMRADGRAPVWGAMESNASSRRLAARIGFEPVGDIVVFSRGHWAFLSGGFEDTAP